MSETKDIYQALNQVMKEVGYVQKQKAGGYGMNYSYAGEAALISAIRPHMVANGIVIHPLEVATVNQDTYSTSKGSVMNRTVVVMTYRFAHAASGTFIDAQVTGEGSDVGDKSANKALTGAYKYALRQTFLIETGDDPDHDASEPRAQNGSKQPAAVARANKDLGLDKSKQEKAQAKTNGGKLMPAGKYRAWVAEQYGYRLDKGGEDSTHVHNTVKLLGINRIPSDSNERRVLAEALAMYRVIRDKNEGSKNDAAVEAMAILEVS